MGKPVDKLNDEVVTVARNSRLKRIVAMREDGQMTFQEIGKVEHISRERVRQLYKKGVELLKIKQ